MPDPDLPGGAPIGPEPEPEPEPQPQPEPAPEPARLIGSTEEVTGGRPIGPTGGLGRAGDVIEPIGAPGGPTISPEQAAQLATTSPISPTFNLEGAPIAILGGVFEGGLPIGGPVTQIFRGGSAPLPNTLFVATITPSGPIGGFFIGSGGAPIGVDTFGGGGLPIGPTLAIEQAVEAIQPRTALVVDPAISFGVARAQEPAPPIGLTNGP